MDRIGRFIRLPIRQKAMAIEAMFFSGKYRYLLLHRPFKSFAAKLGTRAREQNQQTYTFLQTEQIDEIANIVERVCNHTPWKSGCLVRAFTAQCMLTRRGIEGTVFMGVTDDETGKMIAHAWTKCGDCFVTGKNGYERFTVTGVFNTILLSNPRRKEHDK